jgi:hypothetical protein
MYHKKCFLFQKRRRITIYHIVLSSFPHSTLHLDPTTRPSFQNSSLFLLSLQKAPTPEHSSTHHYISTSGSHAQDLLYHQRKKNRSPFSRFFSFQKFDRAFKSKKIDGPFSRFFLFQKFDRAFKSKKNRWTILQIFFISKIRSGFQIKKKSMDHSPDFFHFKNSIWVSNQKKNRWTILQIFFISKIPSGFQINLGTILQIFWSLSLPITILTLVFYHHQNPLRLKLPITLLPSMVVSQ